MADSGLVGAPSHQRLEGTIVAGEILWEVEMDRGIVMVFFHRTALSTSWTVFSVLPKFMACTSL
jgi:hypothetical protein